jgi:hypothetical protein
VSNTSSSRNSHRFFFGLILVCGLEGEKDGVTVSLEKRISKPQTPNPTGLTKSITCLFDFLRVERQKEYLSARLPNIQNSIFNDTIT